MCVCVCVIGAVVRISADFPFDFFRVLSRFWFFFSLNLLGRRVLFYFLVYRCFLLVSRAIWSYVLPLPVDVRFGTDSFGLLCASIVSCVLVLSLSMFWHKKKLKKVFYSLRSYISDV